MSHANGYGVGAHGTPAKREPGERWDVAGAIVTTEHVRLARGWRHEVSVEHDAIDPPTFTVCPCILAPGVTGQLVEHGPDCTRRLVDAGGPVRRRDTLWLVDAGDAQRIARAAVDELRSSTFAGLSALARRLGITTPEHS
jgi:hypothetical protein